jgi:CRP-like cAMP-binding protein
MYHHLLCRYPLFALLTPKQLNRWVAEGQELTFSTGETIFQEGTAGVWVYLIIQGKIRIVKKSKTNSLVSIGVVGPNEIIGEYALLTPHNNTATCRAMEPTKVLQLPLVTMQHFLANHKNININLKDWLRLHTLINHFRNKTFLGFMSVSSALKYLDKLRIETYSPMRTIQAEGFAGDQWFIIEEGTVALHQPNEPPQVLGQGDSFGEQALAGWRNLPMAVALTKTTCHVLTNSAFESKLDAKSESFSQTIRFDGNQFENHQWVSQESESDCGLASLAMVSNYYGNKVSIKEIRETISLRKKGLNLLELKHLAIFFKLEAQAVRIDSKHLANVIFPAIAHYSNGHYVVVFEFNLGRLVIGDPATGIITIAELEFKKFWSERLLLLTPGK